MTSLAEPISVDSPLAPREPVIRQGGYLMLDAWRGIAALSVCFYHGASVVTNKRLDGHSTWFYDLCHYGSLGVQVFFVISGYCIAASAMSVVRNGKPLSGFIRARIRRIYPACWASLLLTGAFQFLAIYLVRRGILGQSTMASSLRGDGWLFWATNLTLTQIIFAQGFYNAVCWTLCYEIAFYMVVAVATMVIRRARRGDSQSYVMGLLHAVTLVSILGLVLAPHSVPFPFDLWPQFGMGVIAFDWLNSRSSRRAGLIGSIVCLGVAVLFVLPDVSLSVMQVSGRLTYLVSLGFAISIILLKGCDDRLSRNPLQESFRVVGLFSYSLYLTHFLILGLVNQLCRVVLKDVRYHYIQFGGSIMLAVLFGWLFYLIAEKPFLSKVRSS